jgi:hypothetical protein
MSKELIKTCRSYQPFYELISNIENNLMLWQKRTILFSSSLRLIHGQTLAASVKPGSSFQL